jgi:hypothetical protein
MKKMYKQPKSEITELTPSRALLEGSVVIGEDPNKPGGLGGNAPKRRTKVF